MLARPDRPEDDAVGRGVPERDGRERVEGQLGRHVGVALQRRVDVGADGRVEGQKRGRQVPLLMKVDGSAAVSTSAPHAVNVIISSCMSAPVPHLEHLELLRPSGLHLRLLGRGRSLNKQRRIGRYDVSKPASYCQVLCGRSETDCSPVRAPPAPSPASP